jgi:Zn-dependent peptidase ImmA (M78 family)
VPAPILEALDADAWEGMVIEFEQGRPVILVRPEAHHRRLNWTIAHELGHILLGHKGRSPGLPAGLCSESDRRHEGEANRFASEILLPADEMRQFHDMGLRTEDIVKFKGVSEMAVRIRIKTMHQDGEYFAWGDAS